MDILTIMESMVGKTISNVNLEYTEEKGETLTISFVDDTEVLFFADDIRLLG